MYPNLTLSENGGGNEGKSRLKDCQCTNLRLSIQHSFNLGKDNLKRYQCLMCLCFIQTCRLLNHMGAECYNSVGSHLGGVRTTLTNITCAGLGICVPDVVMFLDVDLVEHHILFLGVDICLHLHGNVPWQHGEQQALLDQV